MTSNTIKVGEQELEIEPAPITLVFPSTTMQLAPPIRNPKRFTITPENTVYHARRVHKLHPNFEVGWRLFMSMATPAMPVDYSVDPETIRGMYIGAIHLMGLIDLVLKATDKHLHVAVKFPETYLHPGWAVALGDLFIWFAGLSK